MKAPEKIYFNTDENGISYYTDGIPVEREYVGYTRTDAFIEKATTWLREQEEMVGVSFEEDFIIRFRDYMKGE